MSSGFEILAIWVEGSKLFQKYTFLFFVDVGELSFIEFSKQCLLLNLTLGIWKRGASQKLIDDILWKVPIHLK